MAPKLQLSYFGLPGRAEVARLLLTLGNVEFEDKRFTFEEWGAAKSTFGAPFGQLPCLQVDDKQLIAQSAAIDRYCATLADMLPKDPLTTAVAEQFYFFTEDIWQTLVATFRIKDPEEKVKARQELLTGGLADKLKLLSKLIEAKPGKYLTGDNLTHGDLAVFCNLSTLQSGWLDGIPRDILSTYPALKAFRQSVATVPEIAAFYAKENDDIRTNGFRADA